MTITIENEYEFDFDIFELSKLLLQRVLESENVGFEVELSIVISDNAEIKRINREFRGMDKETDVLSFPAIDFENPGDFTAIDLEDPACYNPDTGELILGDMILSYDKLLLQAKEYGHSVKREISFLVVHSLLHLLGYDHEKKEDEIIMREKQTEILESLGIGR